jgi:hypothetical protein
MSTEITTESLSERQASFGLKTSTSEDGWPMMGDWGGEIGIEGSVLEKRVAVKGNQRGNKQVMLTELPRKDMQHPNPCSFRSAAHLHKRGPSTLIPRGGGPQHVLWVRLGRPPKISTGE